MQPYPVEVETHPTFQDGAFLEDQLYTYNVEQTGYDDGTYLTLWVKNQTGEQLAGLHGWSWGGSCSPRTSGSTKTCADRAMTRNSYTQRNRKLAPVAVTI
jgi:hypothetical protein